MSETQVATPTLPGLRGFLRETGGLVVLLAIFLVLGVYVHFFHVLVFYTLVYLPVLLVTGYFAWLRSFHPDRIPAALPTGSPLYRKLKRTGRICLFTALGLFVALIASFFILCLCNNEKLAAHFGFWMAAAFIPIYLCFLANLSIQQYLRERNKISTPAFHWQKQVPRSQLYRQRTLAETAPIQSDHWGQR